MVKSPWKLLTGLLSRGMTADQRHVDQASPIGILDDAGALGAHSTASETSNEGELAPGRESSAASQAGKIETGGRQEPPPAIAADVAYVTPAGEVPALAPDRATGTVAAERRNSQRKASPKIHRKTRAKVPDHARDAELDVALAKQAGPIQANPMAALDSEIRELRSRLAVKLRLQNDQLRQMLKRFEPQ